MEQDETCVTVRVKRRKLIPSVSMTTTTTTSVATTTAIDHDVGAGAQVVRNEHHSSFLSDHSRRHEDDEKGA